MFTVVGALAIIGGALPLIKQGAEAQDPRRQKARKQSQIDPVTAVLQAAKTLSQSLPSPIGAHALSKATNPPSLLVPADTPSPPISDIQVLAKVLQTCRKHGLNEYGNQSLFVEDESLDMGLWVGAIDVGNMKPGSLKWQTFIAGTVVERLTGKKVQCSDISKIVMILPLPETAEKDSNLQKALGLLDTYLAFSLPEKDGKQAFILVGQNTLTQNWLAVVGASGGTLAPPEANPPAATADTEKKEQTGSPAGQRSGSETAVESGKNRAESTEETCAESSNTSRSRASRNDQASGQAVEEMKKEKQPEGPPGRGRGRNRRRRKRRQASPEPPERRQESGDGSLPNVADPDGVQILVKKGPEWEINDHGTREERGRHELRMRPANDMIEAEQNQRETK